MNHTYLSDLLDDLSHEQLTELLNYLAVNHYHASRANVRAWRDDSKAK